MNQYQKTTEKKKQAIIQAALQLFKEKGFKETSINILNSNLDFKTKLNQAFSLCQEKMSRQISDYFQDKMVKEPTFSTLLAKAITAKKRDIYRAYIELGKEEGAIAEDLSTELILNVMDALNSMGNQLDNSDNLETEVEQIHQIFLYGIFGKN